MNEELITKLANEIVNQTIYENYWFYIIIAFITLFASAISAYAVSYLRKRGEHYATTKNFEEIIRQLKEKTSTAEEIKSAAIAALNLQEEQRRIYREKLEAIFEEIHNLELWLQESNREASSGKIISRPKSEQRVLLLQRIYFSKCDEETFTLITALHELFSCFLKLGEYTNKCTGGAKIDLDQFFNEIKFNEKIKSSRKAAAVLSISLLDNYLEQAGLSPQMSLETPSETAGNKPDTHPK